MAGRVRLPTRRPNATTSIEFDGTRYAVTVGYDAQGRPAEIFCHGARVGSAMDLLLDDACVALSLLLQHGADPLSLSRSMGRAGLGEPASIIGALVDLLAADTGEGGGQLSALTGSAPVGTVAP